MATSAVTHLSSGKVMRQEGSLNVADAEALGRAVHERRNELSMTQGDVAQRSGLSVSSISGIERGAHQNIRVTSLVALDRALRWEEGTAALHYSGLVSVRQAVRSFGHSPVPKGSEYVELLKALARLTDGDIDEICTIILTRQRDAARRQNNPKSA